MEIALILGSLAGVATAATINRFPRKPKVSLLSANSHITAQIDSLRIEKDILTKTISRLHSDSSDLSKTQRDKLLLRYQHQLGVILSKIEKMEQASRHPDLGPLGDGLIMLMDQKLSALDKRLAEISSKIQASQVEKPEIKKESKIETAPLEKPTMQKPEIVTTESIEDIIKSFAKPGKRLELTTLTEIPTVYPETPATHLNPTIDVPKIQTKTQAEIISPAVELKQDFVEQIKEAVQAEIKPVEPIDIEKIVKSELPKLELKESEAKPEKKKKLDIPEAEEIEDDEDDLDSIKREIMKTLSRLEQAEIE